MSRRYDLTKDKQDSLEQAYALMNQIQQEIGKLYYIVEEEVNVQLAPEVHKLEVKNNNNKPPTIRIRVI